MTARTVRLKLPGIPVPDWTDAFASDVPKAPWIIKGSGAVLQFLVTNRDGDTVVSPTGLTAITVEIYKDRTLTSLLIAPSAVSLDDETVTIEQWNAGTDQHIEVTLTAAQTTISALDEEAASLDAWMEVRGTYGGENCFLGSGPLRIYRGSTGGTPEDTETVYYTAAQVAALIAALPTFSVTDGVCTMTIGGTPYAFPVGS